MKCNKYSKIMSIYMILKYANDSIATTRTNLLLLSFPVIGQRLWWF